MAIKICPGCNSPFTCSESNDCWCESIQIHKKEMMTIMEYYHDCLCPDCLKRYEKE